MPHSPNGTGMSAHEKRNPKITSSNADVFTNPLQGAIILPLDTGCNQECTLHPMPDETARHRLPHLVRLFL